MSTLRTALIIEGDASGAAGAANQAAAGVRQVGAETEAANRRGAASNENFTASERNVMRALQESVALKRAASREQAQLNALAAAGTNANSVAGKQIAELAAKHYDLGAAQKQGIAATNESNSAFDRLANTLTRRLIFGVIANEARKLAVEIWGVKDAFTAVADTSRLGGISAGSLQGLQAAGGFKGISTTDVNAGAMSLAKSLNEGVKYANDLSQLFATNGRSLKDGAGNAKSLIDVLAIGADLVRGARTEQDKLLVLQQMGLPPTAQWVKLLEQGGAKLRQEIADAQRSGLVAADAVVRKAQEFDERWQRVYTNASLGARAWAAATMEALDRTATSQSTSTLLELVRQVPLVGGSLAAVLSIPGRLAAGGVKPQNYAYRTTPITLGDVSQAVYGEDRATKLNPDALKRLSIEQQSLSLLGQTTTATEARRIAEIQLQQAVLSGIPVDQKRAEIIKQLAYEQNLGITAIKAQADALSVEAGALGMSAGEAARYTAVQNQLNEAKRNGRIISADGLADLNREAEALGRAAAANDNLKTGFDSWQTGWRTFSQELRTSGNVAEAALKGVLGSLNRLTDKLVDMAAGQVWNAAFGGSSGGGGFLSRLFGGGGSGGGNPVPVIGGAGDYPVPTFFGDVGGYTGNGDRRRIAGVVHGQEWVINAEASAKHFSLLQAINDGRFPGFDRGGYVGPPPMVNDNWSARGGAPSRGDRMPGVRVINNGAPLAVESARYNDQDELELTVRGLTRDEMASPRTNGIQRQKYGQGPRMKRYA